MPITLNNGVVRFVGTISHGTLRTEDLIEAFMEEIREIDITLFEKLNRVLQEIGNSEEEKDYFLCENLFYALESYAPDGYYFGSHPGDGSDFGWWPE